MSTIKIQKAKLNNTKKGTSLILWVVERDDNGDDIESPAQKHSAIIQPEIKAGFDRLGLHLAIMAGYVKAGDVEDIAMPDQKLSDGFRVTQFSIGGDEGEGTDGVTLSGTKILAGGKAHNFNTPFYRFNEGEASRYPFMDDVVAVLTGLDAEIIAYKKGEKRGQPIQQELPLEEAKVTKMQVATPLDEKVSPEAKLASKSDQHKYAGKVQMEGVAEMDQEEKPKSKSRKKVAQTADNPDGIAAE